MGKYPREQHPQVFSDPVRHHAAMVWRSLPVGMPRSATKMPPWCTRSFHLMPFVRKEQLPVRV